MTMKEQKNDKKKKKSKRSVNRDSTKRSFPVKPFSNLHCKHNQLTVSGVKAVTTGVNKRQRIPMGQSKMDNPEKLATKGTQDEEKQNKNTTQYELYATIRKQTNNANKT